VLHFADIVNQHDFIHNVVAFCDPERFEMSVATLTSRGTLNREPGGLRVAHLRGESRLTLPRTISRLRRLVRDLRIDVLHSHHYEPAVIASLALVGLPVSFVLGRHYSDTIYRFSRGMRQRTYLAVESACNARATAVVVPSGLVEAVVLGQGVARDKVAKIPYGIDFARFSRVGAERLLAVRGEWPSGDGLRLAAVGRLHPEKGQEHLLRAMAQLRSEGLPLRLVLAGSGHYEARLRAIVTEIGLADSVRFLGWRTDVLDIIAAADAVVHPSLNEAFSQVMLESMALGRALVISDVGGVSDIVENRVSGLVVPVGDAAALASSLRELTSPGLADRLGANAARIVRDRLDLRRVVRLYEDLYRRVSGLK
jgi:glycosyltransferase involved in cell wall biosynthesis